MKANWPVIGRIALWVVGALALAALLAATILVTTRKHATHLEDGLFQFITFLIGAAIAFYFGQRSVRQAAADVVRPQAKSALRRLVSLGRGIALVQQVAVDQVKGVDEGDHVPGDRVVASAELVAVLLSGQLEVVNAAIEDWREFTPDLVNDLEQEGKHAA